MDRTRDAAGVFLFVISVFQNGRLITEAFEQAYDAGMAYRCAVATDPQYLIAIFEIEGGPVTCECKANQIDEQPRLVLLLYRCFEYLYHLFRSVLEAF